MQTPINFQSFLIALQHEENMEKSLDHHPQTRKRPLKRPLLVEK